MSFNPTTAIPVTKRDDGLLEKDEFNPTTSVPLPVWGFPLQAVSDQDPMFKEGVPHIDVDSGVMAEKPYEPKDLSLGKTELSQSPKTIMPISADSSGRTFAELVSQQKEKNLNVLQKGAEDVAWFLDSDIARNTSAAVENSLLTFGAYPVVQGVRGAVDTTSDYSVLDRVTRAILLPDQTPRLTDKLAVQNEPAWAKIVRGVSEDILSYGITAVGLNAAKTELLTRDLGRRIDAAAEAYANERIGSGTTEPAEGTEVSKESSPENFQAVKNAAKKAIISKLQAIDVASGETGIEEFIKRSKVINMLSSELSAMGETGSIKIPDEGDIVEFTGPDGEPIKGEIKKIEGNRAEISMGGKTVIATLSQLSTPKKSDWSFGAEPSAAIPGEPIAFYKAEGENLDTSKAQITEDVGKEGESLGYKVELEGGKILQNKENKEMGGSPYFNSLEEAQEATEEHFANPPSLKGVEKLLAKVEELKTNKEKFDVTKEGYGQLKDLRSEFKGRINKNQGNFLQEELSELPSYYITKKGGISPDEAASELNRKYGMNIEGSSGIVDYFKKIESQIKQSRQDLDKYSEKNVKLTPAEAKTIAKEEEKKHENLKKKAQKEMEKMVEEGEKVHKKAKKVAFKEGREHEAELRKKRYFGSEVTPQQRKELYVLALDKGVIYVDYTGKEHDKLAGIIRYYKGASFDQLKAYLSALSGNKENPAKLFKLYGDIDKDAEAVKIINEERKGWRDINKVEVYSLDTPRIIEKVTKQDMWDGNILADNTFNLISTAHEAIFDDKSKEIQELKALGVKAGSKESQEIMRKFEAKEELNPKEQKVVNYLRKKYDDWITRANEMRELIGLKPIPYRKDYMTHIVESNTLHEFFLGDQDRMASITEAQMDAIKAGDYTKGNMPFNRFAQRRMGKKTRLDAIGNYEEYLNTILYEIHITPAISHSRKFIQYALNKQPNAFKALDRYLNDLKGKASIVDQNLVGAIAGSTPMKWIRSQIRKSALIGNINFWMINSSNFAIGYGEIGGYTHAGMTKFMFSKEWKDFALKNSVMLKGRLADPDAGLGMLESLEKTVSGITGITEQVHVGGVFLGAYFKACEQLGYDKETAIKYADDITRRTQTGYKPYEINAWMRSNSGKLISQFQIWTFNSMNHVLYDMGVANIPEDLASMFKENKTNRTRWKALIQLVVACMIINAIYKKLGLREPLSADALTPSVAGLTVNRYSDIGPARTAKDVKEGVMGKTDEKKKTGWRRAALSVVTGGAQIERFIEGKIFPKPPGEKKKRFSIRD